jgi:DNA polymerase III subunit epsilon
MREIILDTETTGFAVEEHRVLEIGCVEVLNRLPTGRTFQVYLNPEREIDWTATRVHGITAEKVAGAPRFTEVVSTFLEFVGDSPVVAHNASFDLAFMNMELTRAGYPPLGNPVVDTLALARQKLPGQRAGLDALCRYYGIDLTARTYHGALLDAQLLAEVYLELTGGVQGNLLGAPPAPAAATVATHPTTLAANMMADVFPVIAPSDPELEAHQAFISGQVPGAIWLKDNA